MTHSNPSSDGQDWPDEAFIERTKQVWSKAYGRPISREEALEIIGNVHQLGLLLAKEAKRRKQS